VRTARRSVGGASEKLIDDDTARFVAKRGAYIVPTMLAIFTLVEMGRELGFPAVSEEKAE
jgi:hypothetical protein